MNAEYNSFIKQAIFISYGAWSAISKIVTIFDSPCGIDNMCLNSILLHESQYLSDLSLGITLQTTNSSIEGTQLPSGDCVYPTLFALPRT